MLKESRFIFCSSSPHLPCSAKPQPIKFWSVGMTHTPMRTLAKTQFPLGHRFENYGAHQQEIRVGIDKKPL